MIGARIAEIRALGDVENHSRNGQNRTGLADLAGTGRGRRRRITTVLSRASRRMTPDLLIVTAAPSPGRHRPRHQPPPAIHAGGAASR